MPLYTYTCDECNKAVKTYSPEKCEACKINLCESCKKKHKFKLCQWCADEIPAELRAKRRTAIILMLITPILLLILPVPLPAVYMFIVPDNRNRIQLLILFGLIGISFLIYLLIIAINKKNIMKTLTIRNSTHSSIITKSEGNAPTAETLDIDSKVFSEESNAKSSDESKEKFD